MDPRLLSHLVPASGAAHAVVWHQQVERRRALRIKMPFPVMIRGVRVDNYIFEEYTRLDNLSACGLYLRLPHYVELGQRIFAVVRLAINSADAVVAPCVAFHGTVVRMEPQTDGTYGLALSFTRHRFMYADAVAS